MFTAVLQKNQRQREKSLEAERVQKELLLIEALKLFVAGLKPAHSKDGQSVTCFDHAYFERDAMSSSQIRQVLSHLGQLGVRYTIEDKIVWTPHGYDSDDESYTIQCFKFSMPEEDLVELLNSRHSELTEKNTNTVSGSC